jgi:hypothetical protein
MRYNLECAADIVGALSEFADRYRESTGELSAAWQDANAGAIWSSFAAILDRMARSVETLERNGKGARVASVETQANLDCASPEDFPPALETLANDWREAWPQFAAICVRGERSAQNRIAKGY